MQSFKNAPTMETSNESESNQNEGSSQPESKASKKKAKSVKSLLKSSGKPNRENRFLKFVSVDPDSKKVKITIAEPMLIGTNSENGAEVYEMMEMNVKCPYPASKDFIKAMKGLTRHAFNLVNMEDQSIEGSTVHQVKVSGEIENRNARVVMKVAKELKRTVKLFKFTVPQTTLFDQVDYDKAPQLVKALEEVIDEVWLYIGGKHEFKQQLSVFND